jgi:hypothetical protein
MLRQGNFTFLRALRQRVFRWAGMSPFAVDQCLLRAPIGRSETATMVNGLTHSRALVRSASAHCARCR